VIPTLVIDRATSPGGEQLVLSQRGTQFMIRVAGVELMSSGNHVSEDELGRLSCARVTAASPRILIGGLGMGFTLRAALDVLPATAHVEIVELVPAVVRWNREIYGRLAKHPLADPRVALIEDDVAHVIEHGPRLSRDHPRRRQRPPTASIATTAGSTSGAGSTRRTPRSSRRPARGVVVVRVADVHAMAARGGLRGAAADHQVAEGRPSPPHLVRD